MLGESLRLFSVIIGGALIWWRLVTGLCALALLWLVALAHVNAHTALKLVLNLFACTHLHEVNL